MGRSSLCIISILLFLCLTVTGGTVHAQVYENTRGQLRSLRDEEGSFLLNYDNGALASQIVSSDENLVFRQFDGSNRVTTEVFWSSDGTTVEKEISYDYEDDRIIPLSETRWFPAAEKLVINTFTEAGLSRSRKTYVGTRNPDAGMLTEERNWMYDSQNRLKTETVLFPAKKQTARTEYSWNDGRKNPDEQYYENNTLVRKTVWSSDTDYREQLYFDNGFSILSEYADGIQVLEIVMQGDTEIRRTVW